MDNIDRWIDENFPEIKWRKASNSQKMIHCLKNEFKDFTNQEVIRRIEAMLENLDLDTVYGQERSKDLEEWLKERSTKGVYNE